MITQKTTPNTIWKTGWIKMLPMMRHGMTGGKTDVVEMADLHMDENGFLATTSAIMSSLSDRGT